LTRELLAAGVEIVVVGGGTAALDASNETRSVPIVFVAAPDPDLYVVQNLARPEANVTGVGSLTASQIGKRLELLKEAFPGISRVGMLPFTTASRNADAYREARALRLELVAADVQRREDLARGVAAVARPDAWFVQDEVLYLANAKAVVEVLTAQRKPAIYPHTLFARAGGLMSLGTDLEDQFKRAASFVDKILRGARPGDLPVEMPTTFTLAVHRGTARNLGLTIPRAVLLRANEVID
jgi:putative ABC transport system substrate-binding protein